MTSLFGYSFRFQLTFFCKHKCRQKMKILVIVTTIQNSSMYSFISSRALATGISQCGSGVGQFVFAPLANYLLNFYGWKTVIWVVAALYLTCTLFGSLFRSLMIKEDAEDGNKSKLIPSKWTFGNKEERICPFSRKDLFYSGSGGKLMKASSTANETFTTWDDFRHLLLDTERYYYYSYHTSC